MPCHQSTPLLLPLLLLLFFPSPFLPSWMADCENTRINSTIKPPVDTVAKSNNGPLLEQTRWLGSRLSFPFLASSFPVSFFLPLFLGEPAEPQGRRRELLHNEVSRQGKTSGSVATIKLTICQLQLAHGYHPGQWMLHVPHDPRAFIPNNVIHHLNYSSKHINQRPLYNWVLNKAGIFFFISAMDQITTWMRKESHVVTKNHHQTADTLCRYL